MENQQGQQGNGQPAGQQGQVQPEPAGGVPQNIQQWQEPAVAPAVEGQGVQQGTQPTTEGLSPEQHFQRLYNKTLAEYYKERDDKQRLQQQYMEALQRQAQPQQQQQVNPYDPQTQGLQWWEFENQKNIRTAVEESRKAVKDEFNQMIQQANELQWQQQHPAVDVQAIKAFNRVNGIAEWNLEAGYKLMNFGSQFNQIAQTQAQQALNNFRQPQTPITPVRGAPGAGNPQTQYASYEALALQYQETNGNVAKTWPKEVQDAFNLETTRREAASRRR